MLLGTTLVHNELEECVANFVRKPAAIVFGMGYVTNSAIIPVLIGKVYTALPSSKMIFLFRLLAFSFKM